ncbi:hypothetical protein [Nonomuraea gerenzanensis]|uniref:Uncharacterized protein n=1 Tax=Nonomuraea gerenzanensis TaxID=93944 RepID=A0A1M4E4Y5_9ACTN|nr:hypothetical protein [Nonomuraea gerenzanensis]UBU16096.1 hypothetical protein LCN96_14115 [Nonomuraea gerenzanensis]SBO93901.1 hypothetical protein BN4615_P3417 [Nonomuraea gerenzanensis]
MDPIVLAAGTALVAAMATDAWEAARDGAVALWRRARPAEVEVVGAELEGVRGQVLEARADGDEDTERALAGSWQIKLQALLRADPALAVEIQRVLDEVLRPALASDEQGSARSVVMKAKASDQARIYQAGRDQHITER